MRRLILGIAILMAVPAYVVGQERDGSEPPTRRTAIPREQRLQGTMEQSDRHAEPRGERSTSSNAEPVRGRWRDEHPQAAPARLNPGFRTSLNPGFRSALNPGFGAIPERKDRRPEHHRDYLAPYLRSHSVPNVLFVPYASPLVIEREVVVERQVVDEAALAPVIVGQPAPARLILDVHPTTAQIFADGYYIGIPEDFRFENGGAVLEPGPHRIDILARDYEPVSFDVNLTRGQSATFRHTLTPVVRALKPAPAAGVNAPPAVKLPATFYLIPGCYMGNVPPKEANLRPTCDIDRVVVFQY